MSRRLLAGLVGLAASILGWGACAASQAPQSQLPVVATTAVIADLARQVGGERVAVQALVPPGAEAHTYQPTPQDARRVAQARVIFANGLGLDASLDGILKGAASPGSSSVVLSQGIQARGDDPHLWLSVPHAMAYVVRIRDAFVQADPAGAARYRQIAAGYLDELAALDREMMEAVASIPPQRRKLVTFHDAFGYLAERYGLEVVGFVLKGQGGEPSAAQVAQLVRDIRAQGVPAVFTEPQFSPRILELAAQETGVRVLELYSDTVDERSSSYVAMMRANARALAEGLR